MTDLTLRIAAVVVVWLVAMAVLTVAYTRRARPPPPPPLEETLPKADRQPIRVVPLVREPERSPVRPAPQPQPEVRAEPPPAQAKTVEDPPPRSRNICERTGGWREVTRGGRSWRCHYPGRRRRHMEKQ